MTIPGKTFTTERQRLMLTVTHITSASHKQNIIFNNQIGQQNDICNCFYPFTISTFTNLRLILLPLHTIPDPQHHHPASPRDVTRLPPTNRTILTDITKQHVHHTPELIQRLITLLIHLMHSTPVTMALTYSTVLKTH